MARIVDAFTPQSDQGVAYQRALAQNLMQTGLSGAPREWSSMSVMPKYGVGHGLTQLAQTLSGAMLEKQAQKGEAANEDRKQAALAEWLTRAPAAGGEGGAQPTREQLLGWALEGRKLGPMGAAIGGEIVQRTVVPPQEDAFTLAPGEKRFKGKTEIASAPDRPEKGPNDWQEYQKALADGSFKGGFLDYQLKLKAAGAPSTNVSVNTEKGLYGPLAGKMAEQYAGQFEAAQKAPELVARAQRVKQALNDSQAITGAGAEWALVGAKVAAQFGFNTGDAAADTEMLARELASSTLDAIKASGLGAGSGFSNADRDFLEKAVGGKISMEGKTLARLADLNEKAARASIQRWNSSADRLDKDQLRIMGMQKVWMEPEAAGGPKRISTDAEYNSLPKGSEYIAPDGSRRTKR